MIPFADSSYRAQVFRLRQLAEKALARYPIRCDRLEFIKHGENATFRVHSDHGKQYLLRIHRGGYHTSKAIGEELKWLRLLKQKTDLIVPDPILSRAGRLVESVATEGIPNARDCVVFNWIDGRFIGKSHTLDKMRRLGEILGLTQKYAPSEKTSLRDYWRAGGLLGPHPKFGPTKNLIGVSQSRQSAINDFEGIIFKKIKNYEKKYSNRMGLIHADAHFGNVLQVGSDLSLIDFDDCGVGFHVYDLCIPILSMSYALRDLGRQKELPIFQEALFEGYSRFGIWDSANEKMVPYFLGARRILMLGWMQTRSDNPRIRGMLKMAVSHALRYLRSQNFS